mmetsp:Transcript_2397/g.3407  ORF Transcript_2397/g.3407 Transcript_2397/m.3407 type:complete len:100 (+) Transcript_2397:551-850(+)
MQGQPTRHVSSADSLAAATSAATVRAATTALNAVSALCDANGANAHLFWAARVAYKELHQFLEVFVAVDRSSISSMPMMWPRASSMPNQIPCGGNVMKI